MVLSLSVLLWFCHFRFSCGFVTFGSLVVLSLSVLLWFCHFRFSCGFVTFGSLVVLSLSVLLTKSEFIRQIHLQFNSGVERIWAKVELDKLIADKITRISCQIWTGRLTDCLAPTCMT